MMKGGMHYQQGSGGPIIDSSVNPVTKCFTIDATGFKINCSLLTPAEREAVEGSTETFHPQEGLALTLTLSYDVEAPGPNAYFNTY